MEERLLSLFVSMLNLGLAGGLAALLVLPVRLALSRAPKRYSCWLWAAVFFRFACPFVPQSPLALVAVRQQASGALRRWTARSTVCCRRQPRWPAQTRCSWHC